MSDSGTSLPLVPGTADRRFTEQRGHIRRAAPFGLSEGRPPERERPKPLFAVSTRRGMLADVGDALLDFRLGSGFGLRGKR